MADVVQLSERLKTVLDGDFAEMRDDARQFIARADLAPVPSDTPSSVHRQLTLDWIEKMVEAGYTSLPYPEQYGGGGKRSSYINIVEVIGHQDLSLAIKQGVQFGLFGLAVESLGTDKHNSAYLPGIMQGDILGGFAMTEVGGGSDVQGVKTEAIYDHASRSFVLHTPTDTARKAYIGNAALHGEMMVVFAQLKMTPESESMGVHAFLTPVRDKQGKLLPGVAIEDCGHKIGLNGVDNGYISFDNVKLPYDALLNRFAQIDEAGHYQSPIEKKAQRFFKMISTLVTGRVFVSMVSLSGAKNALATSIDFAANRSVFGENLLDKQATQSRLFPHLSHAYAMHFATRDLLDAFDKGSPELETMAAALKAKSSDAAILAIDEARCLTGGAGYMSKERYGALRNDVDIFRTFEGDNTVLRLLVAKNRLGGLAQQFNKASGFTKLKKMISMKMEMRAAKFNAHSRDTDEKHLLDGAFQQKLFADRERAMLHALSGKLMGIARKEGSAVAANKCQDDMIAYADAYAERVMMESFVRKAAAQHDPEVKAALTDMRNAYAVHAMRQNGLWYVENGFMTRKKTKSLIVLEQKLHEKIKPNAKVFTDAFAIPEEVLHCIKPALQAVPQGRKPGKK